MHLSILVSVAGSPTCCLPFFPTVRRTRSAAGVSHSNRPLHARPVQLQQLMPTPIKSSCKKQPFLPLQDTACVLRTQVTHVHLCCCRAAHMHATMGTANCDLLDARQALDNVHMRATCVCDLKADNLSNAPRMLMHSQRIGGFEQHSLIFAL